MTSDDSDSNGRRDMSKEESRKRKRRIERKWLEEQKFYREHEARKQRIIEKYDRKKRQFEEGLLALTRSLVDAFGVPQLDAQSSDFSSHHPVLSAMNHVRDKLRFEKGNDCSFIILIYFMQIVIRR
ncbi:uncharacterized protein LOC105692644 isoform X1 [Athalia rosae]|uniref:uncharacterized protein LOC105692644 isoform X1 n=1 Tax=Athalia rosae TaxID=37344 RepID=UPI002033209A|nr:uncharacterized protein LOC105692644 isoform X1 [Athalia rosae]